MMGGLCVVVGSSHTAIISNQSSMKRRKYISSKPVVGYLDLSTCFIDHSRQIAVASSRRFSRKPYRKFVVVNDLGGQYEESFEDVKTALVNYFTFKAVKTVLNQLYEMNPPQYVWFYQFVATNNSGDGKRFISKLGKVKHDLAERVMVTRLYLYGKWMKKCDHSEIYSSLSDENLMLMRERLMETVIWPSSDDSSSEKIG